MSIVDVNLKLERQARTKDKQLTDAAGNEIRRLHQAYLNARLKHGKLPVILIEKDGQYIVFENDVYAAAQHCEAHIIPSLYHMAVVDQLAVARLQAAGFEIVYANFTEGANDGFQEDV